MGNSMSIQKGTRTHMNLQCHLRLISPTYKEYKLPIRWELGSLNKQNKKIEKIVFSKELVEEQSLHNVGRNAESSTKSSSNQNKV